MSERPQNKHLKPFKKGQSGNPKGRPKLPDLKDLLEELGDKGMREVVEALHKQAKKGNVKAIQELLDRYYGRVKQSLDLSSEDGTMTPIIGITFKEDE